MLAVAVVIAVVAMTADAAPAPNSRVTAKCGQNPISALQTYIRQQNGDSDMSLEDMLRAVATSAPELYQKLVTRYDEWSSCVFNFDGGYVR